MEQWNITDVIEQWKPSLKEDVIMIRKKTLLTKFKKLIKKTYEQFLDTTERIYSISECTFQNDL